MNPINLFLACMIIVLFGWAILFSIGITIVCMKEIRKMIRNLIGLE